MLVPDLNVVINAETRSSGNHERARSWFDAVGNGAETVAIPEMVLLGFVRITTGEGVKENRIDQRRAFEVCDSLRRMPAFGPISEGPRHWSIFREIVFSSGVSGKDITDAYLAAFAIENDATFVTFDRGFRRFPGVRLEVLE
jgi:toxin-antitoxin system PIN domain toxin